MTAKADILAQLRGRIASIEQQGADVGLFESQPSGSASQPPAAEESFWASPASAGEGSVSAADAEADNHESSSAESADEAHSPQAAYQKILRLISVRERSTAYLRTRLLNDEFPAASVEEALAKAQRLFLVDDRRYGDALIRMKLAAGKGLRDAEREIEELGIDPTTLDAWQEHHQQGREAEVARALSVLRRRPPRAKQAREAAFRKLVSQGYGTDIASSAARQWYEETHV